MNPPAESVSLSDRAAVREPAVAAPPPQKRRRRRWLRLIAINLAVLLVLDVLVGSVVNRALFPPPPELVWGERNEVLGFRPRANVSVRMQFKPYPGSGELMLAHNGQSFRNDREIALEKPPGTRRIAIVGDSHTAGITANPFTYPAQLELLLSADGPVEVINAGVKRYSPYQSYLRLEHELLKYDPDVAIAAIYIGNDLLDLLRFDDRPYLTIEGEKAVAHPPRFVVYADPPLPLWSQNSFCYRYYRNRFGYSVDRALMLKDLVASFGGGWGEAIDLAKLLGESGSRAIISQTLAQAVYFWRYPAAADCAFAVLRQVVLLHQDLARRDGHDLRFLLIPTKVHAEPRFDRQRIDEAYRDVGLQPEDRERDAALYARARDLLVELGAHVIDPLAEMQESARTGHALYWYEFHLNNWGAEVVAQVIADDLRTR